jgi:hypothetical protein
MFVTGMVYDMSQAMLGGGTNAVESTGRQQTQVRGKAQLMLARAAGCVLLQRGV